MKKFRKILLIMISYLYFGLSVIAGDSDAIKEGLLNQKNTISNDNIGYIDKDITVLDNFLIYIKDSLTSLLMITVVGVFLYLGIKLILARGNPEEFKKTMMHFVYVAIGMFVIAMAYAAVKMVSGINLF